MPQHPLRSNDRVASCLSAWRTSVPLHPGTLRHLNTPALDVALRLPWFPKLRPAIMLNRHRNRRRVDQMDSTSITNDEEYKSPRVTALCSFSANLIHYKLDASALHAIDAPWLMIQKIRDIADVTISSGSLLNP